MTISASSLRQNIYKILDQIIETGIPVEIHRKGKTLKIEPPPKVDKLKNLQKRRVVKGDPDELIHLDWSREWKG